MSAVPIIPWIGGKRRLAAKLLPLFPPHDCYVEALCGSAALLFLRDVPAKVEVINDMNGELVNLYRVVQHHLEEFVRQFKWALSSRQVFAWLQETKPHTLTDIQRAARFFYLQHHAFGGKVTGQSFGTAATVPIVNLLRLEETLSAAHLRLTGVTVENLPWLECAERYDRPHTFTYLDPPYWQAEGYGVPFEFGEYERMAAFASSAKGRVMISINDHPDIRAVFRGLHVHELTIRYSVNNLNRQPPESKELVITSYEPAASGLFACVQ
ncbi:DNA adenine methylase [Dyella sp.]|uniref:DNA adenine methylase n=1 Tax=Dyella sp. TaxID=1869338 RepID=UPI002FD95E20